MRMPGHLRRRYQGRIPMKQNKMKIQFVLFLLLFVCTNMANGAVGPVSSNGFQHYLFWQSDTTPGYRGGVLYHVSMSGTTADTHIVKRYQPYYLAVPETIDICTDTIRTSLDPLRLFINADTAYTNAETTWFSGNQPKYFRTWENRWLEYRHDSLFITDTLNGMSPVVYVQDTLVRVHLGFGSRHTATGEKSASPLGGLRKYDFLVVNGKRCRINGVSSEIPYSNNDIILFVEKSCPTGRNMAINAVFRTLPCLKTLSTDAGYKLLADPNFPNKLYAFYISDSGRVMCHVSWDNGLSWEEWNRALSNAVMTDSTAPRSGLSASISLSGLITLSWSGNGSGTTLQAPVVLDTMVFYVRPSNDAGLDVNNTGKSVQSPFNSIDRALTQIIMEETGLNHATVLNNETGASGRDTAFAKVRPTASRSYTVKILPGEYIDSWGDGVLTGGKTVVNRVFFPDWDRSLTVESYYRELDSMAVMNGNYSQFYFNTSEYCSGTNPGNKYLNQYPLESGHLAVNRLKFTARIQNRENPYPAAVVNIGNDIFSLANIRLTGNFLFSMDSIQYTTIGRRFFCNVFQTASGAANYLDNIFLGNNVFHRIFSFNAYGINGSAYDYSLGFYLINNTHYKARSRYWTEMSHYGRISVFNSIFQDCASPFSPGQYVDMGNYLRSDTGGVVYASSGQNWFADTVHWHLNNLKLKDTASLRTMGVEKNLLDSLLPRDFYNVPRAGGDVIGACMAGPANPLTLSCKYVIEGDSIGIRVSIGNLDSLKDVDTIMIFRDSNMFVTDIRHRPDAVFFYPGADSAYVSRNLQASIYRFTVVTGKKIGDGMVNWGYVTLPLNSCDIFYGCGGPDSTYYCDTALYIGKDSMQVRFVAPFPKDTNSVPPKLIVPWWDQSISRIWIYIGTDTTRLLEAVLNRDTTIYSASFPFIDTIIALTGDTIYTDSIVVGFGGLTGGTRYFISAATAFEGCDFCYSSVIRSNLRSFVTLPDLGADKDLDAFPEDYCLEYNYPNPFNSSTSIRYGIPKARQGRPEVRVAIYDLRGRLVYEERTPQAEPGYHVVNWGGRLKNGLAAGSGVYYLDFTVGGFKKRLKLLMVK